MITMNGFIFIFMATLAVATAHAAKPSYEEVVSKLHETENELNILKEENYKLKASKDNNCCPVSYEIWLTKSKRTAAKVRAECQERAGGDLAGKEIFGFGAVGTKYFNEISSLLSTTSSGWAWIGLNDIVSEGVYVWLDGTPYQPELDTQQYCGWHTSAGYPRNTIDESHPQGMDCVVVSRDYGFDDIWCDYSGFHHGLCQRPIYNC